MKINVVPYTEKCEITDSILLFCSIKSVMVKYSSSRFTTVLFTEEDFFPVMNFFSKNITLAIHKTLILMTEKG